MKQQEDFREILKNQIAGSRNNDATLSFPVVGELCLHRYHLKFNFKSFEFFKRRYLMNCGSRGQFLITHSILFLVKWSMLQKGEGKIPTICQALYLLLFLHNQLQEWYYWWWLSWNAQKSILGHIYLAIERWNWDQMYLIPIVFCFCYSSPPGMRGCPLLWSLI